MPQTETASMSTTPPPKAAPTRKRRIDVYKRAEVENLLTDEKWSQQSDRAIARKAGVSNGFVSRLRHELCTLHGTTPAATRGLDGKIRQRPAPKPSNRKPLKGETDGDVDAVQKPTDQPAVEREAPRARCRNCGCGHFYVVSIKQRQHGTMTRRECRHCGRQQVAYVKTMGGCADSGS
jgi:hypothetical protein